MPSRFNALSGFKVFTVLCLFPADDKALSSYLVRGAEGIKNCSFDRVRCFHVGKQYLRNDGDFMSLSDGFFSKMTCLDGPAVVEPLPGSSFGSVPARCSGQKS
jgi:hypothetical protein